MIQKTQQGVQDQPGATETLPDGSSPTPDIQTPSRGLYTPANDTSDNKLTWMCPVEEDHGKVAHWHVWYSECKRYRVIRSQSLLGDQAVNFGATRGEKPYQILKAELNTLEKAVITCEQDFEKKHGIIPETNSFSMLADAESKNLHSAKFTLPTNENNDRVTQSGSVAEPKTEPRKGRKRDMATKTAEKVFHLSKTTAVNLLQELGYKGLSEKSPAEKLEHHLNKLVKEGADESDVSNLQEASQEELASTLESIIETLQAKGTVEIVRNEGEEPPVDRNGTAHDPDEEEKTSEPECSYNPEPTETVVLDVDVLVFADYNPAHRTDPKSSGMKFFAKQLRNDGKIYEPILVRKSDRKTIMEGHRRVTACKINGWPRIEARLIDDEEDSPEAVYATINANRRKHNGTETLEVFLGNKEAVLSKVGKKMTEVAALVGKPMLRELAKKGLSARTVNTAIKTCKYVDWMDEEGIPSKDQVTKVLKWMMSHDKLVGKVMRAITEKRPKQMASTAKAILEKIEANEPLDFEVK